MWRHGSDGEPEVLIVHRPKYDDWSLPKGKLDAGERHRQAAVREVEEETGYLVTLGDELPSTSYNDRYGRPKRVRYWTMTLAGGEFTPNDEVDEIRWLSVDDALSMLTYDRDRSVLQAFRK